MCPSIHVGPGEQPELARAVETAGGSVVSLGQADGVVWAGRSRTRCPTLPRSVRWVQLPSAGVEPWMERIRATPQVTFTSAAGAYAPQVAEHALALLLAGVRGIVAYARGSGPGRSRRTTRWRARPWRSSAPAASAAR